VLTENTQASIIARSVILYIKCSLLELELFETIFPGLALMISVFEQKFEEMG
jgi:hypothetical protein